MLTTFLSSSACGEEIFLVGTEVVDNTTFMQTYMYE